MLLDLMLACGRSAEVAPEPAAVEVPDAPKPAPPRSAEYARELRLTDAETGADWSLSGLLDPGAPHRPTVALIAFVGPECPPCDASLPTLAALEDGVPGLEVVSVVLGGDVVGVVQRIRAAGVDGPVLRSDANAERAWIGRAKPPAWVFVDRAGRVVSQRAGFDDSVKTWLPAAARRAMAVSAGP